MILTDTFSKYSQAFVTSNQKSLTVDKLLVEKWFSVFGIPTRIHSDHGRSFDNEIISHLCKMYGIRQSTTMPYNLCGNSQCEQFNHTLFGLMKLWNESRNLISLFICLLWSILIMQDHIVQQVSNHTSSCLGIRHQCLVTIGLGSRTNNQIVLSLRLPG